MFVEGLHEFVVALHELVETLHEFVEAPHEFVTLLHELVWCFHVLVASLHEFVERSHDDRIGSRMDVNELRGRVAAGETFEYLHFWGHSASPGRITAACLSQWYPQPFEIDAERYETAEHWMMAEKARLFGDDEARAKILAARHPRDAKRLGRAVRGFDQATWEAHRFDLVVKGNAAKFGQSAPLRTFLLETGDRVLVEASPTDRIWGIGLSREHPDASHPDRWPGLNLLGFALMDARTALSGS